jgi:flavin-dependent dehydrogenase
MYDVSVVGARCAGSSLAMLLARAGAKVLLVDRASFPSNIPHGHFIHRHGPPRLKRWGLLDRIARLSPAVTSLVWDAGDFPLFATDLSIDGVAWAYGPRRDVLDMAFVDAAVESGAELRTGFAVDEYIFENGSVVGIRGRDRTGKVVEERATLIVGADGRNSRLARAVQAPVYDYVPPLLCYYFSYWSGVESNGLEMYIRNQERHTIFAHPTSDDLFVVFVGWPADELHRIRANVEQAFMDVVAGVPDLAERLQAGHREERFYGVADLPNFYRKPYGPGWALVGDAGYHKDPYMAMGICDALRDADYLAEAIGKSLGSNVPAQVALGEYERRRNEASAMDYKLNLSAARFDPLPPEVYRLREAVRDNPQEARRLIMARMGMIEPTEFFNPANIQRILAGVPSAA